MKLGSKTPIVALILACGSAVSAFPQYRIIETLNRDSGHIQGYRLSAVSREGNIAAGRYAFSSAVSRTASGIETNLGSPNAWTSQWTADGVVKDIESDGSFIGHMGASIGSHVVRYELGHGFHVYDRLLPNIGSNHEWEEDAFAMSPSGLAVGSFHRDFDTYRAMAWHPDGTHEFLQGDERFCMATDISDNGMIAGIRYRGEEAGFWDDERIWHPMSNDGSSVRGWEDVSISRSGDTISAYDYQSRKLYVWNADGSVRHVVFVPGNTNTGYDMKTTCDGPVAFKGEDDGLVRLWSPTEGLVDLNNLLIPASQGYSSFLISDISENGVMVGNAMRYGTSRGILIEPVPEPGSLAAVGVGIGLIIKRRRR